MVIVAGCVSAASLVLSCGDSFSTGGVHCSNLLMVVPLNRVSFFKTGLTIR